MSSTLSFSNLYHSDEDKLHFYSVYWKMANTFGCYYMGYILEDTKTNVRAGFTTDMTWGTEYFDNFITECHLWRLVQSFYDHAQNTSLILPWETAPPTLSLQKDIILRRAELGIGENGISFCQKLGRFREYYYFAPENNNKSFVGHISKHFVDIKSEILNFRRSSLKLLCSNGRVQYRGHPNQN